MPKENIGERRERNIRLDRARERANGDQDHDAILRKALEHYLEFLEKRQTLAERINLVQAKAKALGIWDLSTDDKALMDEMWDDFLK